PEPAPVAPALRYVPFRSPRRFFSRQPMGVRRLLLPFVLLAAWAAGRGVHAQVVPEGPGLGAVRDTFRVADGPTLRLRPNVVPGSEAVWLLGPDLDPMRLGRGRYALDPSSGLLKLAKVPAGAGAVLAVHYRTLPALPLAARRVLREEADSLGRQEVTEQVPTGIEPLFGEARLERRGSISRGITAGSNRDVSV